MSICEDCQRIGNLADTVLAVLRDNTDDATDARDALASALAYLLVETCADASEQAEISASAIVDSVDAVENGGSVTIVRTSQNHAQETRQ